MPAISDLFRQGWPHDASCQCVSCLKEAYASALTKAVACGRRYKSLREDPSMANEMARARTEWTSARQETVLADHAFRAAEDRDYLADAALKRLQAETPAAWTSEAGL